MKQIKILHLFPHLLSLYGEYGNVAVLQDQLRQLGHQVSITKSETIPESMEEFDMVYLGSGTEDNLLEALKRMLPHTQQLRQVIEGGQLWLATGNTMALFGSRLTRTQEQEGLNILPYTAQIDDSKRFLGDVLSDSSNLCGEPFVGFVNTSCIYQGVEPPLLQLKLGAKLGNDKASCAEGIHLHRFYGTQLIGPVLAKNPHFLALFCKELTGEDTVMDQQADICMAYQVALKELTARLEN